MSQSFISGGQNCQIKCEKTIFSSTYKGPTPFQLVSTGVDPNPIATSEYVLALKKPRFEQHKGFLFILLNIKFMCLCTSSLFLCHYLEVMIRIYVLSLDCLKALV
jgi:hypothetical protein